MILLLFECFLETGDPNIPIKMGHGGTIDKTASGVLGMIFKSSFCFHLLNAIFKLKILIHSKF